MSEYLDKEEILFAESAAAAALTWRQSLYCNAKVTRGLKGTAKGFRTGWIAYAPGPSPTTIWVDWVAKGTRGAVQVDWGPRERTCELPFYPVLLKHPVLMVESGWVRPFPFRIEAGRMLLDLVAEEVRMSIPQQRKWGLS